MRGYNRDVFDKAASHFVSQLSLPARYRISRVDHLQANQKAWNQFAESGSLFAKTATDAECRNPLKTLDGRGWLPDSVAGLDVLCLAAGGGWQSVLYAAAGARVTVVDISDSMLKLDEQECRRRGFPVRTIQASMDELGILADETFDIVHQPVSTCYIPDLRSVYREIARIIRDDGIYISQHKQPISLQISHRNERQQFVIGVEYYHEGPLPLQTDNAYRESGTTEYLHTLEHLIGDLCVAGFTIEDLREPKRADYSADVSHYGYRGRFVPPYLRMKAKRRPRSPSEKTGRLTTGGLWIPGAG